MAAALRLLFDRGDASPVQRLSAVAHDRTVEAALRCMLAERSSVFAHRVQFQMHDGSTVIAKPRAWPA